MAGIIKAAIKVNLLICINFRIWKFTVNSSKIITGEIAFCGSVNEVYSHGEELKEMGLNVPEVTDIFLKLKASGVDCKTDIYTVEQGVEEYKRLLGGAVD